MKKNKWNSVSNLNYIAALCMYIASILYFINEDTSMGALFLCLGSSNLCIGTANKKKEDIKEQGNEKKDK